MNMKQNEYIERHIATHTTRSAEDRSAVAFLESALNPDGRICTTFSSDDKWPNHDGFFEYVSNPDISKSPKQNFIVQIKGNHTYDANIVQAANRFIQNNTLRHEKHMHPSRTKQREIREISVANRKAQYSYLFKVAASCTNQAAVLYRDHECALPLIDLLERNGIPYRMRNVDITFFTNRVVMDISNIIKLAADPQNTELFLQVYYKLGTYLRKQDAHKIADISRKQKLSVWEAAL